MSLLLTSTFILFAVIGRIAIQFWFTGDHGARLASSSAPLAEKIPGLMFLLSFLVSTVLIVLYDTGLLPVDNTVSDLVRFVALSIGFIGIAIVVIAQVQMGRSWRIGVKQSESTDLILTGLYSKSRNPIYFGILLYWIAMCVTLPQPAIWACAVICWISIEFIVRNIEEPYLRRVHGAAFEDYCRTTRRYLIL
ncbi:MAG: isoprenylcysteine carboxylmethyltransferase family protein [Pseudomonadales bacterium]